MAKTFGADDTTNFRGIGSAPERSTTPSYHEETPLSQSARPDVSMGNGGGRQSAMPKADTSERVQRRIDENFRNANGDSGV